MQQIFQATRSFLRDEDGVTAIEYALIAALIGVAVIGGASALGTNLNAMFTNIGNRLANKAA